MFGWLKLLFSLMPDLTGLKELGFKVKTFNSDLYVEYAADAFSIRFYQGFEPHHPSLGKLIDFEIPDGVVIVLFKEDGMIPQIGDAQIEHTFENCIQRKNLWVLFDRRLDFSTPNMNTRLEKVIKEVHRLLA